MNSRHFLNDLNAFRVSWKNLFTASLRKTSAKCSSLLSYKLVFALSVKSPALMSARSFLIWFELHHANIRCCNREQKDFWPYSVHLASRLTFTFITPASEQSNDRFKRPKHLKCQYLNAFCVFVWFLFYVFYDCCVVFGTSRVRTVFICFVKVFSCAF